MSFDRWISVVDVLCLDEFGLSIHDLPDMDYRASYEADQTPHDFMAEYLPDVEALGELILS